MPHELNVNSAQSIAADIAISTEKTAPEQVLSKLALLPRLSIADLVDQLLEEKESNDELQRWIEEIGITVHSKGDQSSALLQEVLGDVQQTGPQNHALILAAAYRLARAINHQEHESMLTTKLTALVADHPKLASLDFAKQKLNLVHIPPVFMKSIEEKYSLSASSKSENMLQPRYLIPLAGVVTVATLAFVAYKYDLLGKIWKPEETIKEKTTWERIQEMVSAVKEECDKNGYWNCFKKLAPTYDGTVQKVYDAKEYLKNSDNLWNSGSIVLPVVVVSAIAWRTYKGT